jgi:hypothetical protein
VPDSFVKENTRFPLNCFRISGWRRDEARRKRREPRPKGRSRKDRKAKLTGLRRQLEAAEFLPEIAVAFLMKATAEDLKWRTT